MSRIQTTATVLMMSAGLAFPALAQEAPASETEELSQVEVAPPGGELPTTQPPAQDVAAAELAGVDVMDIDGREIGRITDIVYSDSGEVSAAVVTTSGFLGFNRHSVAVPVEQLTVLTPETPEEQVRVQVPMTKSDLRAMPEHQLPADPELAPEPMTQ